MSPGRGAAVIAAVTTVGAAATRVAWGVLTACPPGGAPRWDRTNHRGDTITLLEGPAFVAGVLGAVAVPSGTPGAVRLGAGVAAAGAGAFGAVDDLTESGSSKGLRGHLGELARGHLTTGGLKVLGIGATGLVSAALILADRGPDSDVVGGQPGSRVGRGVDLLTAGALIAGSANLLNLLDLRPGRALKATLLAAPVLAAAGRGSPVPTGRLAAAAVGPAAALMSVDLGERAMLGDTGANAAGAVLGAALVAGTGRRGRPARAGRPWPQAAPVSRRGRW